jgi:hypothetical protein
MSKALIEGDRPYKGTFEQLPPRSLNQISDQEAECFRKAGIAGGYYASPRISLEEVKRQMAKLEARLNNIQSSAPIIALQRSSSDIRFDGKVNI